MGSTIIWLACFAGCRSLCLWGPARSQKRPWWKTPPYFSSGKVRKWPLLQLINFKEWNMLHKVSKLNSEPNINYTWSLVSFIRLVDFGNFLNLLEEKSPLRLYQHLARQFQNQFCKNKTSMTQAGMNLQLPIAFPTFTCSSECSNLGGTSGSSCAEGFGVCCSCKPLIDGAIFHTYISLLKTILKLVEYF